MDFFDDVFQLGDPRLPDHPVYFALFAGEQQAQKALEALDAPLTQREAGQCLRKALEDDTLEIFRQILDHTVNGECTETQLLDASHGNSAIQGHGSLLLLAAMLDRPRHAAVLLERGYDCNSAGLDLAETLGEFCLCWGRDYLPNARFCGCAGSHLMLRHRDRLTRSISCATPLSAALLCGSLQTAQLLLRRKDTWKRESTAVCRAAVMVLEGVTREYLTEERQANQLEILRQIFCPELDTLPDRETFLGSVYLQPDSFADICATATLRCQLESGLCTEADGRRILQIFASSWWSGKDDSTRAGKLLLLKRHFPRLCRESWAAGLFLRETMDRMRENKPYKTILTAWKQLAGKERDLTYISMEMWRLNWTVLRKFLREAEEGGALIMDADAMCGWYGTGSRSVVEILKHIRFRQRDDAGVSGVIAYLLSSQDLRLLQQAVKLGLLEREDPKQLIAYLTSHSACGQDLRAMVLTYARNNPAPGEPKADWRDLRRWSAWDRWNDWNREEAQAALSRLLRDRLPEEECLWTMFQMFQYLSQGVFAPDLSVEHPEYPTLQGDSLVAFACCAPHSQLLELLLEKQPELLLNPVRVNWGERFFFRGTPLALAAAMGRTRQVQLLLDSGMEPDERGRGQYSRITTRNSDYTESGFRVTPLLAAILFGQEETARLLLERGAGCDFSRPEHLRVLYAGSGESLRLAERLPGVGFEHIPAEELENLRIITGPAGERTAFWNSLKTPPF